MPVAIRPWRFNGDGEPISRPAIWIRLAYERAMPESSNFAFASHFQLSSVAIVSTVSSHREPCILALQHCRWISDINPATAILLCKLNCHFLPAVILAQSSTDQGDSHFAQSNSILECPYVFLETLIIGLNLHQLSLYSHFNVDQFFLLICRQNLRRV